MLIPLLPILIAALIVILMLFVGAVTTKIGAWYWQLKKPSYNPPSWVFAPAWTLILACAGWAGVLGWQHAADEATRALILALFVLNILTHMAWSPLFFNLQRPDWALLDIPLLWASIVGLIVVLWPVSLLAACLLLPYFFWVSFATLLNWQIVKLNRPFGQKRP